MDHRADGSRHACLGRAAAARARLGASPANVLQKSRSGTGALDRAKADRHACLQAAIQQNHLVQLLGRFCPEKISGANHALVPGDQAARCANPVVRFQPVFSGANARHDKLPAKPEPERATARATAGPATRPTLAKSHHPSAGSGSAVGALFCHRQCPGHREDG